MKIEKHTYEVIVTKTMNRNFVFQGEPYRITILVDEYDTPEYIKGLLMRSISSSVIDVSYKLLQVAPF